MLPIADGSDFMGINIFLTCYNIINFTIIYQMSSIIK